MNKPIRFSDIIELGSLTKYHLNVCKELLNNCKWFQFKKKRFFRERISKMEIKLKEREVPKSMSDVEQSKGYAANKWNHIKIECEEKEFEDDIKLLKDFEWKDKKEKENDTKND